MRRWKKATRKILAILFVCILMVPGGAVHAEENAAQDVETQEQVENRPETEQKMAENQRAKTEKGIQNEIALQSAENPTVPPADSAFQIDYADGPTQYFTEDASLNFQNATKITLLKDIERNLGTISIKGTAKDCILDLNGYTWTDNYAEGLVLAIHSELTIENGTIVYGGAGRGANTGCICVDGNVKVTVEKSATLQGNKGVGILLTKGEALVKGKVSSRSYYAILGSHTAADETKLTIVDGAEIIADGTAIFHDKIGTVNVEGGTISGKQGIEIRKGTLNISGAPVIEAYGPSDSGEQQHEDLVIKNGIAVSLAYRGSYNEEKEIPRLNIDADCTGKMISEQAAYAVRAYVWNDIDGAGGGTWNDAQNYVKIAGGWFNQKVDRNLCADGYQPTNILKDSGLTGESEEAPYTVVKPEKAASGTVSVSGDAFSDKKEDVDRTAAAVQKEAEQIAAADSNENLLSVSLDLKGDSLTEETVPTENLKKLKSQVSSEKGETITMYADVSVGQTKKSLDEEGKLVIDTRPLSETKNVIPITLKVPGISKKFVRVLHVHDGVTEELPCIVDRENETVQVSMNKFSTLAVVTSENVKVTFDSQGGSSVKPAETIYGGTVEKPTDPTRTGYRFMGWYRDAKGSQAFDFTTALTEQDVTLYAKWEKVDSSTGNSGRSSSDNSSGSGKVSVGVAKTGDQANIWLYAVLCVAALCGVVVSILSVRRKKH